ncbi:hypothetical protein SAMN05216466_106214 [Paraburkholderia phenazinium]|uniref:Uncharacterized protein n=1 Tax=Paraburkholderia phenazinium TaxID=60549 RepID=A0A1G7YJ61_9BURK|nr:hypothetical protein [Paraburkholderia phenazinium]SDG96592.1 hypothetical protein SAMN05216466_106214 [Paraburkholderia phenazinium]
MTCVRTTSPEQARQRLTERIAQFQAERAQRLASPPVQAQAAPSAR